MSSDKIHREYGRLRKMYEETVEKNILLEKEIEDMKTQMDKYIVMLQLVRNVKTHSSVKHLEL